MQCKKWKYFQSNICDLTCEWVTRLINTSRHLIISFIILKSCTLKLAKVFKKIFTLESMRLIYILDNFLWEYNGRSTPFLRAAKYSIIEVHHGLSGQLSINGHLYFMFCNYKHNCD